MTVLMTSLKSYFREMDIYNMVSSHVKCTKLLQNLDVIQYGEFLSKVHDTFAESRCCTDAEIWVRPSQKHMHIYKS